MFKVVAGSGSIVYASVINSSIRDDPFHFTKWSELMITSFALLNLYTPSPSFVKIGSIGDTIKLPPLNSIFSTAEFTKVLFDLTLADCNVVVDISVEDQFR
jgi:hypothetical protein